MVRFQAVPQVKRREGPKRTPHQSPLVVHRGLLFWQHLEVSFHGHPKTQVASGKDVWISRAKHGKHVDAPGANAFHLKQRISTRQPWSVQQVIAGACGLPQAHVEYVNKGICGRLQPSSAKEP